jgi:putative ABC transport system substrate-binding protein
LNSEQPMKTRRQVLLVLSTFGLALSLRGFAQQAAKLHRIGFLASEKASDPSQAKRLEILQSALRDLGYVEGKNVIIEVRWADGQYERLPALASDLVARKVSVIVTSGSKASIAAKEATATIPIVMGSTGDPIGLGLTTDLARPSRNITGTTNLIPELGLKLLEALKEAAPRVRKVAFLVNPADPATNVAEMKAAARSLNFDLHVFEARTPSQFDGAFADMAKARTEAVVVQGDTLFAVNVQTIARLALGHRFASASSLGDFADVGGLITYAPNRLQGYSRAAVFVDKLLKGAKPADLPIERPTKFESVVNMRTARALGLVIPQSLALRANRVIE